MDKKHISLLLTISLISALIITPAFAGEIADTGEASAHSDYICDLTSATDAGLVYSLDETNKEMTITGYTGNATSLTISDNYGGYRVTKIGEKAFYGKGETNPETGEYLHSPAGLLESIELPDTITYIGEMTFAFTSFKNFDMPDSVTSWGSRVFVSNYNLESLKLSQGYTGTYLNGCFWGCKNLKKIFFPGSLTDFINNGSNSPYIDTIFDDGIMDCQKLDIYYPGTLKDWRSIKYTDFDDINEGFIDAGVFMANIHLNSTYKDYLNGKNLGVSDDLNVPYDYKTEVKDNISFNYNSKVIYNAKNKISLDDFGTITVSYNGEEFIVTKIKTNKKTGKFRIIKTSSTDKAFNRKIKKITKGSNGLDFSISPYHVKFSDKVKEKNDRVKVLINGKFVSDKKFGFYTNYNIGISPNYLIAAFRNENKAIGFCPLG